MSALNPEHRAQLNAAAISDDVLDAMGDFTASTVDELPEQFREWANTTAKAARLLPCPVFTWRTLDGRTFWQIKPRVPSSEDAKYLFPSSKKHPGSYTPIGLVRDGEPGGPVLLQEGTKQARAAASHAPAEWSVYALPGCQSLVNGRTDLTWLAGRAVVLSFDADRETNEDVKTADEKTTALLWDAGARSVTRLELPAELIEGETDGLDDVLARADDPGSVLLDALTFAEPVARPEKGLLDRQIDPSDDDVLARLFGEDDDRAPNDWGTDSGQARFIWASIGHGLLHCDGLGWLLWDGKRWAPRSEAQVLGAVEDFYKARFDQALAGWSKDHSRRNLKKRAEFFASRRSIGKINATTAALKIVTTVDGAEPWNQFDAHPYLLNTPSGVADLRTGELLPHDRDLMMTKMTRGAYRPGFRHADWAKALEALPDDETRAWVKVRSGAACVGEQIASDTVFFHGDGENGKTVLLNEGVFVAVGTYGHRSASELIGSTKADQGAASPELADLRGVRFALIEELPQDFYLSTKRIKDVAGTSTIRARMLYQNPITFRASHDLFVNTNYVPSVTETDWGTWRRLTMVPFPFTYTAHPQEPNELVGDAGLAERVAKGEDGQQDAIVTWLVEGAVEAVSDPSRLRVGKRDADDGRCETVRETTRQWRVKNDLLMAYADEHLVPDAEGVIAKTDFVAHFGKWLKRAGMAPWSAKLVHQRSTGHPSFVGVSERFTRDGDKVSRPPSDGELWPDLPTRTRVLTGVRFAVTDGVRMVGGRRY